MSGGHFNHDQYRIQQMADDIQNLIETNSEKNEWGGARNYPQEVLERFAEAEATLRLGAAMATRIDWLVSGDDGEDNFMERWAKEEL